MDTTWQSPQEPQSWIIPTSKLSSSLNVWRAWALRTWKAYYLRKLDSSSLSTGGRVLHNLPPHQVCKEHGFLCFSITHYHFHLEAPFCHGGRNPGRLGACLHGLRGHLGTDTGHRGD